VADAVRRGRAGCAWSWARAGSGGGTRGSGKPCSAAIERPSRSRAGIETPLAGLPWWRFANRRSSGRQADRNCLGGWAKGSAYTTISASQRALGVASNGSAGADSPRAPDLGAEGGRPGVPMTTTEAPGRSDAPGGLSCGVCDYWGGISTRLMAWITPFEVRTSAWTTRAPPTRTVPPRVLTFTRWPARVSIDRSLATRLAG
jgi:hypothetical protein